MKQPTTPANELKPPATVGSGDGLGHWSKAIPTKPGTYEFKCEENFFIPEKARVYMREGKGHEDLWVDDDTLGSNPLGYFHDGLISLEWRKVA